jgi:hypothetical protein
MRHAGARPVGERQAGKRLGRLAQEAGNCLPVLEIDLQRLGIVRGHIAGSLFASTKKWRSPRSLSRAAMGR